jgi:hypothetical protein
MPLVDEKILHLLQSNNEYDQIKGLQILGSERHIKPSKLATECAIKLLKSGTSYVKETAIFSMGLHWACIEAYPIIVSILKNRFEDEDTLIMAVQAMPRYMDRDFFEKDAVLSMLASIVLDESVSKDLRAVSYVSALIVGKRISDKKTIARIPDEFDKLEIDWCWLKKIKGQGATSQFS